jgi:hypothetical protein
MKQTSERLGVKIVGGLKEVNTPWAGSSFLIEPRASSWFYDAGFATNPITPRAPITGRASCPLSRESNNQTHSTLDSLGKANRK